MHKNRIFSNNEVTNRPIIRILLNMQSLPSRDAHCPVRELTTAICFLENEDFFSICNSYYQYAILRNF